MCADKKRVELSDLGSSAYWGFPSFICCADALMQGLNHMGRLLFILSAWILGIVVSHTKYWAELCWCGTLVGAGVTLQCFLFNGCHDVADFCKLPQAICEGRHAIVAP
ncbi:hypothetical protein DEO72_LG2g886 [Vigna unguiculata]|uniref:Uncharacterized protein n=1 Tax=Vigna unguiculata TaxID=3917 RepID=A0A4D6L0C1_VIGUN|nr:hypothetical protein DEO72_LG2g886 [Vigna unguiculata]